MRECAACGQEFRAQRPHARYCSDGCRKRGQRAPKPAVVVMPAAVTGDGLLVVATRTELAGLGRLDSPMGAAALLLAARLDRVGAVETGGGLASLMREYRATLADAISGAERGDDALSKIREAAALKVLQGGRSA